VWSTLRQHLSISINKQICCCQYAADNCSILTSEVKFPATLCNVYYNRCSNHTRNNCCLHQSSYLNIY
uniref:Uncharacterized protein n=1 Tax=Ciona intestinalis TaxID=7719 RepID=H2Y2R7_CIOIN